MTREELKQYISEAVDALEQQDIEQLFPPSMQPDLYSLAKELVGLRGDIKQLAQSTLQMNNEVQNVLELYKEKAAEETTSMQPHTEQEGQNELKPILQHLIKQDDVWQRTNAQLQELPEPGIWSLQKYKQHFASWKRGYDIAQKEWSQMIKDIGFYKTGLPGETFDPQMHEAIATKRIPSQPDNTILETEVEGYLYKQRLIQKAKVVVNKTSIN